MAVAAGGPPCDIPLVDWPRSSEARAWFFTEVAPWALPPLFTLAVAPLACVVVACVARRRKCLPHAFGLVCAAALLVSSAVFLAGAIYEAVAALGTATALEGAALNATQEAAYLTCLPPAAAHVNASEAFACEGGAGPSPTHPPACRPTSILGFTDALAASADETAGTAIHFVDGLGRAVDALKPVEDAGQALATLSTGLAGNLTTLNHTIEAGLRASFARVHSLIVRSPHRPWLALPPLSPALAPPSLCASNAIPCARALAAAVRGHGTERVGRDRDQLSCAAERAPAHVERPDRRRGRSQPDRDLGAAPA